MPLQNDPFSADYGFGAWAALVGGHDAPSVFIFTEQTPEVCGLPDGSWRRAEAQPRVGPAGDRAALGCASQAAWPAPRPELPFQSRRSSGRAAGGRNWLLFRKLWGKRS